MQWLCVTFGTRTRKIWPFEAAEALGTTVAAKAPRGSGGLSKQKYVLEVPYSNSIGGPIQPQRVL